MSTNMNGQSDLPRLCYTAQEAGRLLGIGRTKVYELMASGALGSILIGRSRRIPADRLRQFVADQERAAA